MKKNYNDLVNIEAYLRGELDDAERLAFEAQLKGDAAMRQELEAYSKLFDGLRGLRNERFADQVAAWAKDAKQATGHYPGVEGAKIMTIKQGHTLRSLYRRLAWAAGFALVLGASIFWFLSRPYSDEVLLAQAYTAPRSEATMGGDTTARPAALQIFDEAHSLFQQEDYAAAAVKFDESLRALEQDPGSMDKLTRKFYLDNARWTLLLSNFAAGRIPEDEFLTGVRAFANDPSSDYAGKAADLLLALGSFWRR